MSAPGTAPRMPPPTAPDQGNQNESWQVGEAERYHGRQECSGDDLTLSADVDDAGPEGNGDSSPDQDQGRRLDSRRSDAGAASERTVQHGVQAGERAGPEGHQHHRSKGEGGQGGEKWDKCPQYPLNHRWFPSRPRQPRAFLQHLVEGCGCLVGFCTQCGRSSNICPHRVLSGSR